MSDYHDVDAEEIWQLINLYADGGYILEIRHNSRAEDGSLMSSEIFWAMDEHGKHVNAWHPESLEVEALVRESLVKADDWQPMEYADGED